MRIINVDKSKIKKIIIICVIELMLVVFSFLAGRFIRQNKLSRDNIQLHETTARLESELENINKQNEQLIARAERLESELSGINSSTDRCLSITRQLRDGVTESVSTVQQLRLRIDRYEKTIADLNSELSRIKERSSIK